MSDIRERNSVYEVLRLILMFMIVLEHSFMVMTRNNYEPLSLIDNVTWFIQAFTYCAVDVFFLITGYFSKETVRISRIVKIWVKTIVYSLGIYLLAVILGKEVLSVKMLLYFACPVLFRRYWFMQTYVVLAILSPFIVKGLNTLSKKTHMTLICILLVFFSVHQTFIKVGMTLDTTQGYGIIWAVVLLIVGNYIKKYGDEILNRFKASVFLCGYIVVAVCIFITNCLIVKFNIGQGVGSRSNFYGYNSISMFIESVLLFLYFVKIARTGWSNRHVNWLAQSSLSIYLISSHPLLLETIWTTLFDISGLAASPVIFVISDMLLCLFIMAVCILIDKLLETTSKLVKVNRIYDMIDEKNVGRI